MKTQTFRAKFPLFFFLGLFLTLSTFGQKNYLPGYVISLSGDSIHGFIDYRSFERNSNVILFKINSDEDIIRYSAADIKGFSVQDEVYESAIIDVETNSVNLNDPGLNLINDTAFVQTMFNGSKSLYYYMNKEGKEQFYIKNDTSYDLLVFKKYYKNYDGHTVILENKKFLGQLFNYLKDCPSIQTKTESAEYSKKSLKKLFEYYYEVTKANVYFQEKEKKISPEFGIISGLSITSLKFTGIYSPLGCTSYLPSNNFTSGVFLDVTLPKNRGRLSLNNELIFRSYEVSGLSDYYSVDKYSTNYSELGFSYLKLNNMVRYKYPVGKCFIYLNAGIFNGLAISEKNYLKIERNYLTEHTEDEVKAIEGLRKHEQGIILGLGTKFKKLSFEVRIERGNGMSPILLLTSKTSTSFFLLGYRF